MKRFHRFLLLLGVLGTFWAMAQQPALPSAPDQYVTDPTGFMSPAARQELTQELQDLEELSDRRAPEPPRQGNGQRKVVPLP